MDTQELVQHARRLAKQATEIGRDDHDKSTQLVVQGTEFLRRFAGEGSAFYQEVASASRLFSDAFH